MALCIRLIESGANPQCLASVITELQRVKKEELDPMNSKANK